MTLDEVKKYFHSCYRFNQMTGMSAHTYLNWFQKGYIPMWTQFRLEDITEGALKADVDRKLKDDI